MRLLAGSTALALVTLTAACGGGSASTGSGASQSTSSSAATSTSTATSGATGAAGATALTGVVGKPDQPNAFTIGLTDSSGTPVQQLKAGQYSIKVDDLSAIHNFHLTGPGVDQETSVPQTGQSTFTVDLKAGTYTFICDPHPGMKGSFTVA